MKSMGKTFKLPLQPMEKERCITLQRQKVYHSGKSFAEDSRKAFS